MHAPDSIDLQIMTMLRQDASLSSGQIAKDLHVSPRTVRARIERLRDSGIIKKFTITIDREKCGYPATADIVIQAEANRVHQIAERIAQFPEAHYVAVTTGSQDISIQVYGRSTDDIHRFVIEQLAPLPGVIRMNTFVLFKIVKQDCWSPVVEPDAEHVRRYPFGVRTVARDSQPDEYQSDKDRRTAG